MKKLISVILMLSMIISMFAVSTTITSAQSADETEYKISEYDKTNVDKIDGEIHGYMGDCDSDSETSVMDATQIQLYVADKKEMTDIQILLADVDNDKYVSVMDATEIQLFAAQKITSDIIGHILYTPAPAKKLKPEKGAKLTVWAPEMAVATYKTQCNNFIADYPDYNLKITVKAMAESDATFEMLNDPYFSADVFTFMCDQLHTLNNEDLLLPVHEELVADVQSANIAGSIDASTINNQLLAYPQTADNGYFLYYDKRYISASDAKTIEGIFKACRKYKKDFLINAGNGYYSSMFTFTGGLKLNGLNGDIQKFNKYDKAEVVATMKAFATLFHEYDDVFANADPSRLASGFSGSSTKYAAGISGSWDAKTIQSILGKNFGVVKLPTIKVNNTNKQIISMHGYRLVGVNSATDYPDTAQLLANYLTNEKSQIEHTEKIAWGPSNTNAMNTDAVKSNPTIVAALEQGKHSVAQTNVSPYFWMPMGDLGSKLCDTSAKYDTTTLEKLLNSTIKNITTP